MSTYSSFLSNIFMAVYIETQSLSKTVFKPTVWKSYIDDIFCVQDISKPDIVDFFKFPKQVNLLHPTAVLAMKFTAEISDTETIFLDPVVYQGTTFNEKWEKGIIDLKTHFERKLSSIYIFTPYHSPIVKMDLTNKKPWEPYQQTPLMKVKNDHRRKFSNLSNWKEEAWKKSGLQRDSNPWPPRCRYVALPTELWSHTLGARSIDWVHISREEWNDVKYMK